MSQDQEHLKLLSIFHYVVAGVAALFALIPVLHLVVGLGLATGSFEEADPMARTMGWFFTAFASAFILSGLGFAACLVAAGRSLARRRHYTFCLVMAGVSCVFMPFGTVLGVFTIIVLMREPVKTLFGVDGRDRVEVAAE
jgi:hypothetical protein